MIKRGAHLLWILASFTVLTGCGGDSGNSDTPTDPEQKFSLDTFHSLEAGQLYKTDITGSATDGNIKFDVSGELIISNKSQEMLDGSLVVPREEFLSFTLTYQGQSASDVAIGTEYFSLDGFLVQSGHESSDNICLPSTQEKLPAFIQVNQFGELSALSCDNGETHTRQWHAKDGKNGEILLVLTETIKDRLDRLLTTSTTTYRLNGPGKILTYEATGTVQGITIEINSL